jgi:hypothetical protein
LRNIGLKGFLALSLLILVGSSSAWAQNPAELRGTWAGTVAFYGTPALVLFDFEALRQPGAGKATVSLPSLGLHSVQVDQVATEGDSLKLGMSALPGVYKAHRTADTLGLAGYLLVAGQRLPLRMSPVATVARPAPNARWAGALPGVARDVCGGHGGSAAGRHHHGPA